MKKIICLLSLVLFTIVLTGCGKGNTVTCSADSKEYMGLDGKIEFKANFDKNDKFESASVIVILDNTQLAKTTCGAIKATTEGVKCSGKKIIFEDYSKFSGANLTLEGVTKTEFKERLNASKKFECK